MEQPRTEPAAGVGVFERLHAQLPTLPPKQHRLAKTILDTPEIAAFGSVRDLAARCEVNVATIVRFARSLGFSGYTAFQESVRDAYLSTAGLPAWRPAEGNGAAPADTAPPASRAALMALERDQASLQAAYHRLREADLTALASRLSRARRIVVGATGAASIVAAALVELLQHTGLRAEHVDAAPVDRIKALVDVGPTDVVVVVGMWLTFRDAVRFLQQARERGATTVAISGSATSPLARLADYALIAPARGVVLPHSLTVPVAVAGALAAAVAALRPTETRAMEEALHARYLADDLIAPFYEADSRPR
jgi:DNA-binding MurR/RpiR family transcriptional regulator